MQKTTMTRYIIKATFSDESEARAALAKLPDASLHEETYAQGERQEVRLSPPPGGWFAALGAAIDAGDLDAARVALATVRALEQREAGIQLVAKGVSDLIDGGNYNAAHVALNALAARVGEQHKEVIRLRAMIHFMTADMNNDRASKARCIACGSRECMKPRLNHKP